MESCWETELFWLCETTVGGCATARKKLRVSSKLSVKSVTLWIALNSFENTC